MSPELIAALSALTQIDAARMMANAAHINAQNTGGITFPYDPFAKSIAEQNLRVWVDSELAHQK
jgi:hypothetical protein